MIFTDSDLSHKGKLHAAKVIITLIERFTRELFHRNVTFELDIDCIFI